MPYVNQPAREQINRDDTIIIKNIQTAGEMQYAIATILNSYVEKHGLCYQTLNDVMGALTGGQLEFYRRVVVPYEEVKIKENGDVYEIG